MNTALLSARKRTITGELRAELQLCGRSVLAWQVDLARQLGCERIICLCDAPSPDILELQRSVEAGGGEFHAVKTAVQLVALLRADDVLMVVLDGLVAEPEIVRTLAYNNAKLLKAVFTLEAGSGLTETHPADFERIDATRCWAGLAIMRAAHAQKLADLPEDGEIVSLLFRLALQARTDTVPVDIERQSESDWVLAKDNTMLIQREDAMLDAAIPSTSWSGPLTAIAAKIVRIGGAKWIAEGPIFAGVGAIVVALFALLLLFYQYDVIGLALITLSAFLAAFSTIVGLARKDIIGASQMRVLTRQIRNIIDVFAILSLCLALPQGPLSMVVLPILVIGLLRLAQRSSRPRVAPFWNDRALQLAGLTICAAYGVVSEGLAVLGLLALVQALAGGNPALGEIDNKRALARHRDGQKNGRGE